MLGHSRQITEGGVGTGTDQNLGHRPAGHLTDLDHIIRGRRTGNHRLRVRHINFQHFIIIGIIIGNQFLPLLFPALGGMKLSCIFIGWKN